MTFKKLIKKKGIKLSSIADALFIDKGSISRRIQKDHISLLELKTLRAKRILTFDDIDHLTSF